MDERSGCRELGSWIAGSAMGESVLRRGVYSDISSVESCNCDDIVSKRIERITPKD